MEADKLVLIAGDTHSWVSSIRFICQTATKKSNLLTFLDVTTSHIDDSIHLVNVVSL